MKVVVHIIAARKRSLGQGNVFTPACHSVHREGVGFPACVTGHMTEGVCLWWGGWSASRELGRAPQVCRQGEVGRPPLPRYMGYYEIRSTSGWYASYWNAFLVISCKNSKLYLLSTFAEKGTFDLSFPVHSTVEMTFVLF